MKKSILMMALVAFLFSMQVNAQEPTQKKKEKAKKECTVNGKKCCATETKKGCTPDSTAKRKGKMKRKS